MDNASVAELLARIALLMELKGENPFKIRSYRNASRTVGDLDDAVALLVERGELQKLKGIGKGINENIEELLKRGSSALLESLEAEVPEGLVDMTRIRGIGPGRVKKLHDALGIDTIGELEYACLENRLVELKGFGPRIQARLLEEIGLQKQYASFFHLHYALHTLEEAVELLRQDEGVLEAAVSGEARRFMEVVRSGVIVASSSDPEGVLDRFARHEGFFLDGSRSRGLLKAQHAFGLPLELHVVRPERFAQALLRTTGSEAHLRLMEGKGLPEEFKTEADAYKRIGLPYIPPELREGIDEIEAASKNSLPRLVEPKDVQGIIHVHTTYSDGGNTLEEMAAAAAKMGYRYLGVSDHSRTASYAGGLSIDELEKQGEEIRRLNGKLDGFKILHGVESDILKDGSLDYPDSLLSNLDFVIASVHSGFRMDEATMTERIIKAVRNPHTRILGHPTGRLLLGREPYAVDMGAVLKACAEEGVMVELNANPHRLDIDWRLLRECTRLGILVAVNPDAHSIHGLEDERYGIGTARKGGIEARQVVNCMATEELLARWR